MWSEPDNAGERVSIGERNRGMSVFIGCIYQFLGMRRARRKLKLDDT